MRHHFTYFRPTWAALAASALVAACGGGSAGAPAGTEDTTPPTVTITDNVSEANATADITFTFTFNEAVSGFTTDDVTVTGGQKGTFSMASNNQSATLVVTPTANSTGTVQVSVAAGSFIDLADNANTAAASGSQDYNTVAAVNPISFASGYTAVDAASVGYAYQGLTTENGAFNWTVADGANYGWGGADFWWSGIASTDATPNFYWGGKGKTDQAYMESWVNAPSNGTVSLNGQTKLRIAVWGNDELVGAARFTPVIQLGVTNGCYPMAEAAPLTPAAVGVATYDVNLSDFAVTEDCGEAMTTAEFMAQPIGSIRARIYKANYYNANGNYESPNGINLGPISFQP